MKTKQKNYPDPQKHFLITRKKCKENKQTKYAAQVFNMRLGDQPLKGGLKPENIYYQSVGWLTKDAFGHARLERELTEAWIQRKFEHGGHKYSCDPPDLTQAEIEGIPSAAAAMGNLDKVEFEVLEWSLRFWSESTTR